MKKKIIATITAIVLSVPVFQFTTNENISQAASSTIAALNYTYSSSADVEASTDATDLTLNKTKYGSKKNGYNFTSGSAKLYASIDGSSLRKLEWSDSNYKTASGSKGKVHVMPAGKKNPWKAGTKPYFEVVVSTKGYKNVVFTAYVGASKKGPKYYSLAYAVGSSTSFKDISGATLALSDNKQMEKISASLPSDTATGNTTKGEVAINNISLVAGGTVSTSTTSTSSSKKITFKKGKKTIKKLTIKKKKTAKITILTKPASAKVKLCKLSKKAKKLLKVKLKNKKLTIKAKKKGSTYIKVKAGKVTKKLKIKVK